MKGTKSSKSAMRNPQVIRGGGGVPREGVMDRTYKIIEVVGCSEVSYAEATRKAVARAAKTLDGLAWFEVSEMRGAIRDGQVAEFQVTVRVGFRLHD